MWPANSPDLEPGRLCGVGSPAVGLPSFDFSIPGRTIEGLKAQIAARIPGAPMGWSPGRGAVACMGVRGQCPRKIVDIYVAILHSDAFCVDHY